MSDSSVGCGVRLRRMSGRPVGLILSHVMGRKTTHPRTHPHTHTSTHPHTLAYTQMYTITHTRVASYSADEYT